MARPSIFAGTPSIFESLRLKQIDLYCKNIITRVLHIDFTLLWYYFLGDQNKYHVTMTSQYLCSTKENAVYSVRCGYQFCSVATEHVEALSARFFTFLWLVSHICAVFVAILNFVLWRNARARIHCHEVNCFSKAKWVCLNVAGRDSRVEDAGKNKSPTLTNNINNITKFVFFLIF